MHKIATPTLCGNTSLDVGTTDGHLWIVHISVSHILYRSDQRSTALPWDKGWEGKGNAVLWLWETREAKHLLFSRTEDLPVVVYTSFLDPFCKRTIYTVCLCKGFAVVNPQHCELEPAESPFNGEYRLPYLLQKENIQSTPCCNDVKPKWTSYIFWRRQLLLTVTWVSMWACMSSMSDGGFIVGASSKYRCYRISNPRK